MSGRCVCVGRWRAGDRITHQMNCKSNSGCPVSVCRDSGRGEVQEMDNVSKRENAWFIAFTS